MESLGLSHGFGFGLGYDKAGKKSADGEGYWLLEAVGVEEVWLSNDKTHYFVLEGLWELYV